MKDLPHHIKKLNRRVLRSIRHEMEEEADYEETMPSPPNWKPTERQIKKQAKIKERDEREQRAPVHLSIAEKNRKMKHRVPVFDRNSKAHLKTAKPTQKKTPRI